MKNKINLQTLLNNCKFKDTINVDDYQYVDEFKLPYSINDFSIVKHLKKRYFLLHHLSMKLLPTQPGHYEKNLYGDLEFHNIRKDTEEGFKTLKDLKECYLKLVPENKLSLDTLIEMLEQYK